jgi:hypothetical protein
MENRITAQRSAASRAKRQFEFETVSLRGLRLNVEPLCGPEVADCPQTVLSHVKQ